MSRSYRVEVEKLSQLETFNSLAFVAEDKPTQDCCDFVLALAVAFNDLKSLLLADHLLIGEAPLDQKSPTRELGSFGGLHVQFFRVLLGTLHELLNVIEKATAVRAHPLFRKVIRNLPKSVAVAWQKIVAASEANTSADADVRFLLLARNTVAYHYGRKAIGQGFRKAFAESVDEPFLSRGTSIVSTRFYFADRAVQAYLKYLFDDNDIEQYFLKQPELLSDIASALASIVVGFVTARGYGWRELPANNS